MLHFLLNTIEESTVIVQRQLQRKKIIEKRNLTEYSLNDTDSLVVSSVFNERVYDTLIK